MRRSSFKPQYRQAPLRAGTPPPPAYEPLSPVLSPVELPRTHPARGSPRNPQRESNGPKGVAHPPLLSVEVARTHFTGASSSGVCDPLPRSAPPPHTDTPYSPALASPIDALANAAVSSLHASPAHVGALRRQSHGPTSPATAMPVLPPNKRVPKRAYFDDTFHAYDERPSKRARSEFFPSPQQSLQHSRPATSHNPGWSYNVEQMMDTGVRMYQDNGVAGQPVDETSFKRLSDAQLLLDFHHAVSASHSTQSQPSSAKRPSISQPDRTEHHSSNLPGQYAVRQVAPVNQITTLSSREANVTDYGYGSMDNNHTGPAERSMNGASEMDLVAQAVQTHTPPEEIFGASTIPKTAEATNVDDKKSRKHQGWPKGRPRGPRQATAGSKKKRSTPKPKNIPTVTLGVPEQLHSPQSLPAEGRDFAHSEDAAPASVLVQSSHDLPSQTRRHSLSNALLPIPQNASFGAAIPRARSVPLNTNMDTPILATGPVSNAAYVANGAPPVVELPVCAGCNSSDSDTLIGDGEQWISCDGCKGWFHFGCAGFKSEREVRDVDKFYCDACSPDFGKTTKVRKSGRAHTAVDYAGLNEGILKTSDDNPEHHYIQAFKNGSIQFEPETFARLPPELVTADYLEKTNGFKEPIVIPAALNPRPTPPEPAVSDPQAPVVPDSSEFNEEPFGYELAPDDGQDKLDMVIPQGLTVRRVAELYGPLEKVDVIDVKSQEGEDKRWNMAKWADYYEQEGEKPVRNVISLEVSWSRLGRLIRRPKAVRDLDLQDDVWPEDDKLNAPKVQFYCLMSVADCYTDFHIDFGGSSVYYHVIKGAKTFFFIPPTKQNLKKYEDWCLSPKQSHEFLGQQVKECYRVNLSPGDTMLIPSGWIHAVWTPKDSLVIGGNFLTRLHYGMQIQVAEIEKNTKVAKKFRYPYFQKVMWLAVIKYLEQDPLPPAAEEIFLNGGVFQRTVPIYCDPNKFGHNSDLGPVNYNKRYYSKAELDGVSQLVKYIWRTVMISLGKIEGITKETKNAVTKSIPKSHGEPLVLARQFAMWVAWKRGNESIPQWAHPDTVISEISDSKEKKMSVAQLKKMERDSWVEALKAARLPRPTRGSDIAPRNVTETPAPTGPGPMTPITKPTTQQLEAAKHLSTPKTSQLGPKRIACDACRKRRIRCKHKDELIETSPGSGSGSTSSLNAGSATLPITGSHNFLGVPIKRRVSEADASFGPPLKASLASDVAPTMNGDGGSGDSGGDSHAVKSGRVKACADCRKSKRRCIHDENGNVDPVKASEAPVPRGSASKKRRVSDDVSGSGSRQFKSEPFGDAEVENGETNVQNLTQTPSRPSRSATTPGDTMTAYTAHNQAEDLPADDPMDLDEPDNDTVALAGDPRLSSGDDILSSIENAPEHSNGISDAGAHDPENNGVEPRTPGPVTHQEQATSNCVQHRSGISVSPAYSNITIPPTAVTTPNRARSARNSSSGRKPSQTPRSIIGKSATPKSAGKARQDSKDGSIKVEQKSLASSPTDKPEDLASLALALKLQMEEHGLRRRSSK
ncbi:hypothetical protein BCR34DRAFT_481252 [Clohesyomyces aquaticus]|uniref:JmjC domain-containing histone demethylation protein 1 n=1 Tax=Clohesyomyces aquaticus TaxID=1231657 RepID=A0A1Y1ZT99_9PLEO|nr:hypothetical protein BCR34DRAFT_481252 [Clohesyomyces aquaticus]